LPDWEPRIVQWRERRSGEEARSVDRERKVAGPTT
jgi:hypothetical protein